ncbi:polycystic kidney disease protein 1-like 3 [Sander lucioperca]|uniref:Mitochondrial antiviral-signaling protein n=1 Tax=Sander lucioperca TaxID=283035 RepID=A0A8D0D1S2_SANLU|nr:polycystic kidney disease protein 1-like 3 [Sander lucioperca]XP_031165872.1 polycystic kidney disease protein 1-like 3 [Sander lucioperca]XP_031165873.1 polycystic kidney disease protein 1-like 3 [Sander lucioperca]XP_031165874.1 polycystic kidney disease protein 1-like 3 [Sander lucioperca]
MSFASDKLYNGYLRRNMPTIVTKVKPTEIMIHLPCLTSHDRETIEAKRETYGNYDSMVVLLDCLKRRENWPEQFIQALEACEHRTLAAEIRAEYNALRVNNNSNPSSPPTTVVRAHVHPAPSASHMSLPEGGANSQAIVAPPAEASAPPQPAAQASPSLETPVQPQAPQSSAANVPETVSPSEPASEPPQSTQNEVIPSPTPPPSPLTPHNQATKTPPPQRKIRSHQEPVENSESDIQDISGDIAVIPDQVIAGNSEVSIKPVATLQPSRPVEQSETDSPSRPDPIQTTTTTATEVSPPQSPSPTQINSDGTDGSSFPMMTPERPPVQDTTPPVDLKPAAVLQPEQMSGPPATQVVESSPQTETAATTSPLPGAAGMDASLCDDSTVCLSKPGQLISIPPQNHERPTIPAPSSPLQPYSGNSECLEMSNATDDTVTSACLSACSAVSSTTESTLIALPCQENGIALNHNEPEENHYDSPSQSLGMQEVLENVVHVSEEVSILNLDGQSPTPQAQIVNDEAAKEITPVPPLFTNTVGTVSSVNTPSSENYHPSEPAPDDISPEPKTLQDLEKKVASGTLPTNTKYILTAAGVGACALLMAWRFKR